MGRKQRNGKSNRDETVNLHSMICGSRLNHYAGLDRIPSPVVAAPTSSTTTTQEAYTPMAPRLRPTQNISRIYPNRLSVDSPTTPCQIRESLKHISSKFLIRIACQIKQWCPEASLIDNAMDWQFENKIKSRFLSLRETRVHLRAV